jgi:hypothetical protein
MRSKIIQQLKDEERAAFLKLDPVDRILTMERVLYDVLSLKAQEEGVSDGEIYKRYLARDKKRRRAV